MVEQKIWGTTECLIDTPYVQLHRIKVNKGGYCSEHIHHGRANVFMLISGEMEILVGEGIHQKTVHLQPHVPLTVQPGVMHKFRCLKADAVCDEIYYPVLSQSDIWRASQGGVTTDSQ